jgi:hypothetical protein
MLSSLHNRFSVASETKFGAIPPTFPLKAEDKEPAEITNDFLLTVDDLTDMQTIEDVVEEIADNVVENITMTEVLPEPPEPKEMDDEIFETFPPDLNEPLFVEPAVLDDIISEKVVENITISITQSEVPEPPELKETEDEVIEKIPPVSNNPLFIEPAEFVLDDIYTNYDDDNFEEQKPAKKKRGVLKTFLNEFKPTYRKKLKKSKSII